MDEGASPNVSTWATAKRALGRGATISALASTMLLGVAQPGMADECSQPVGTVGSIPDLVFERSDWPLAGDLHMATYEGHVERNLGVVEATTRTYGGGWFTGDRGAVIIVLRNDCGDVVGVTKPREFDVAPRLEFWRKHDETVRWIDLVDPVIAQHTASVDVVHDRASSSLPEHFLAYREEACGYWRTPIAGWSCPVAQMLFSRSTD